MDERGSGRAPAGEPPWSRAGPGRLLREILSALLYLTVGPGGARLDAAAVARGSAFFPILGIVLGAAVAGIASASETALGPDVARGVALALVTTLGAASCPRGLARTVALLLAPGRAGRVDRRPAAARAAGLLAALATTGLKGWALVVMPPAAAALALPLAVLLGRWAVVVQAYGSRSASEGGLGAVLPAALEFREFALASVTAMALTLILVDAVGLVLLLWTATQTIALRIAVHARLGGIRSGTLWGGAELAEVGTLVFCAVLARWIVGASS